MFGLILKKGLKFIGKRVISYTSRKFLALVVPAATTALFLRWAPEGIDPGTMKWAIAGQTLLAAIYMVIQGMVETRSAEGAGTTEGFLKELFD